MKKYTWMLNILRTPDGDDGGDSSNSGDDNGGDSSSQQQDDGQQDDQLQDDGSSDDAQQDDGDDSSNDAGGDDNAGDQQNDQQQQADDQQVSDAVTDKDGDDKLPFHKHARFQEVIREKNESKRQLDEVQPLVQQARALEGILRENNISNQEYQSALQYLIALRRDPVAAYNMIKQTTEQLALLAGDRIPDDLQAEVAAGTLDPNRARQIAQAQAQQRYQQVRSQWQQNGQQNGQGDIVSQATRLWVSSKTSIDPDLKAPIGQPNQPGYQPGSPLWEQTNLRLMSIAQQNPPTTPEIAMQNCERAYNEAKAFLRQYAPRTNGKPNGNGRSLPQGRRPVTANTGYTIDTNKPDANEQVARLVAQGVKPSQIRYK